MPQRDPASAVILGDTPSRDYSRKLSLFNRFAAAELGQAIAWLRLEPGLRVLDAGCGTGETLARLGAAVAPSAAVAGLDLALAHLRFARTRLPGNTLLLQADVTRPPFRAGEFDLIWCANTVNHLSDPVSGIGTLAALLRPGGRLALGQSSLLPEMFFAWDEPLERRTDEAVRRYYRERYHLDETATAGIRALSGLLRRAGFAEVAVRTFVIERLAPLTALDRQYLTEVIFEGTWGARLENYLAADDYRRLRQLCDPAHPDFALDRPDFHYLQTFTLAVARD